MRLRLQTKNATPLGMIGSLMLAGLLAVAAFRGAWAVSSSFSVSWWAAAGAFFGGLIGGISLINVRQYTFNAAVQTLIVQDRWLGFIRGKRRDIPFAEIAAVYLRSGEGVFAVVVLRSGKKLYPCSAGTGRKVNRYCAAVKRITHVGRILPAERRARGRNAGDDRLVSALVATACGLVVAEMLFCQKLPYAVNLALIAGFILVFVVLVGLAVRGTRLEIRASFRRARGGVCPNCGCATATHCSKCAACGMRLR